MWTWLGGGAEWRRELAGALLVGLFLGLIGPFGTYFNGSVEVRIGYWVAMTTASLAVYGVAIRFALHLGARWRQPVWFVLVASVFAITLPMSVLTAAAVYTVWPQVRGHMRPLDWYVQSLLMALPLSLAVLWSQRAFPIRPPASPSPMPLAEASLLDRLPPRLGRTLVCLQMEDHYVRVHTDLGSELLLMPLKAAMAEVGAVEGMQVHRSWWVARAAVSQPIQRGRNLVLRLSNNIEAPVGRSFVAPLRANRWLDSISSPLSEPPQDHGFK